MTTPENSSDAKSLTADSTDSGNLIIVDLDRRYTRKQINKLREGRGKLMNQVAEVLSAMSAERELPASAQPIVIVVREKQDSGWGLLK